MYDVQSRGRINSGCLVPVGSQRDKTSTVPLPRPLNEADILKAYLQVHACALVDHFQERGPGPWLVCTQRHRACRPRNGGRAVEPGQPISTFSYDTTEVVRVTKPCRSPQDSSLPLSVVLGEPVYHVSPIWYHIRLCTT